MQNTWNQQHLNLQNTISDFTQNLSEWNKTTFKNIYHKKKRTLARIKGIQKPLCFKIDNQLLKLEKDLQQTYYSILRDEKEFLMLKSRISWLSLGDQNTKFFHRSALIKRRHNKISQLQTNGGDWITSPSDISNEIRNNLTNTFCNILTISQPKYYILDQLPKFMAEQNLTLICPPDFFENTGWWWHPCYLLSKKLGNGAPQNLFGFSKYPHLLKYTQLLVPHSDMFNSQNRKLLHNQPF